MRLFKGELIAEKRGEKHNHLEERRTHGMTIVKIKHEKVYKLSRAAGHGDHAAD